MSEPLDTVSTPEEKAQAAAQGWREEPREGFKTAKEFLEFGEKVTPILKERRDHLVTQVEELRRENQGMKEAFFKAQHEAKLEGYRKAKAELLEKQEAAFQNADEGAYKRATAALEKLEPPEPVKPPAAAPKVDPAFVEWQGGNVWYGTDKIMSAAADVIGKELAETTSLMGAPFYKEVERRIKEEFPHKFGNQNRRQPSSAESGGGTPPAKTGKKDFASLPSDIKAGADYAIKSFGYKDKDTFAAAWWREADKNGWA